MVKSANVFCSLFFRKMTNYSNESFDNQTVFDINTQFASHSPLQILEIVAPQVVLIDRIVSPIWYIIGLFGNPVSAIIWLSKKMRKTNSSAVYFGSVAIVQTIFLLINIFMELETAWGVNTYHRRFLCESVNFLSISLQYLVPMLILGFTVERYIAVCHPFAKEKYCTVTRAKIVICCMALVAIVTGSVQIYIWAFSDMLGCSHRPVALEFNTVWTWITELLFFGAIPVGCLIINVLVIMEIKRISIESAARGQGQSSNAASTTTLLSVSFFFILTLLPATLVYAIQNTIPQGNPELPLRKWPSDPVWDGYFTYLTIRKLVEEICLSNYAVNFIIYFSTGEYFRREVKGLFGIRKLAKRRAVGNRTSEYSLVTSNGKTMTETVTMDLPSSPC